MNKPGCSWGYQILVLQGNISALWRFFSLSFALMALAGSILSLKTPSFEENPKNSLPAPNAGTRVTS